MTQTSKDKKASGEPLTLLGQNPTPVELAEIEEKPRRVAAAPKSEPAASDDELVERLKGGNFRLRAERMVHQGAGLHFSRLFTRENIHPYDEVQWETRSAKISNDKGETIFEQTDLEFPTFWSQLATNVVVSKYFRGKLGGPTREHSLKEMINRVVQTLGQWGMRQHVFAADNDRRVFEDELTYLLLHQKGSFNSPVWFNVGIEKYPQCSACFINAVEDSMESIMELAKTEGMLFKWGSGTGTNLSSLRSSREHLSTGGIASGPVSFMRGYDAFAGVIKSGGKTRRAAKMVILDIAHPDILDFIQCKVKEEKKAWALIDAGFGGDINGEAYSSVFFQNSNNSVRVPDEFMTKVKENDTWYTRGITDGKKVDTFKARELLRLIAEATHTCGDPGLQFDTTINDWNPCADTARIRASNPCSEYMFLDDSACNLASLNLMSFVDEEEHFDVRAFSQAIDVFVTAQEIIVDNGSYPRKPIALNSHAYRPLGLGYTNLGALLMSNGIPYDSEPAFAITGAITALLTGRAYRQSAIMARDLAPFQHYDKNSGSFLRVIKKHRAATSGINPAHVPTDLFAAAQDVWREAEEMGSEHGFRNAQVTVLAPTGTISFMMDADTTGIEPDLALVKYKQLVGGGSFKIVNRSVPKALQHLGYSPEQASQIVDFIDKNGTIEGAPFIKDEHLAVFDCALRPLNGKRYIHHHGHLRMMAAAQPFISGAISKTVNVPEDCTVEEISDTYVRAWELGLKAVAIYRNNSKRTQPLSTGTAKTTEKAKESLKPLRRKLPDERAAITHKFSVGGHEGYITVGMYEDGAPGEIFLVMAKEGSSISGMLDGFATMTSLALQYGVPLDDLVSKFSHTRFEPSGFTGNPEIPLAKSIYDYIFRWLASKFLNEEARARVGNQVTKTITNGDHHVESSSKMLGADDEYYKVNQQDAPTCRNCGAIMVRAGSCYFCQNCATTDGCG